MLVVLVLMLSVGSVARAQSDVSGAPDRDPRSILARATRALDALAAVRYDWTYTDSTANTGTIDGSIVLQKRKDMSDAAFRASGRERDIRADRGWPALDFVIASDGQQAFWLSKATGTFHRASKDKGGLGIAANAFYGLFTEFANADPFADLLALDDLSWRGREPIAGVVCDMVRAVRPFQGGGRAVITWFFGVEDGLPRAQRHEIDIAGAPVTYEMTLANLTRDPPVDPGEFILEPQPGFDVVDEDARQIAVGRPAPPWRLRSRDGRWLNARDFPGQFVILAFWNSTCPVCRTVLPKVAALTQGPLADKAVFLAINTGERSRRHYENYLKKADFGFTILEEGADTAIAFKVAMTPGLYAIDPEGNLLYVGDGVTTGTSLEALRRAIESWR